MNRCEENHGGSFGRYESPNSIECPRKVPAWKNDLGTGHGPCGDENEDQRKWEYWEMQQGAYASPHSRIWGQSPWTE